MPSSILNLKFKGNKSFVAFSNLGDSDSLTKTWKVCSKVASYLEQGQRLENLSWRLWHLQNLMVESDNAKSKREFRKLSKVMGDKLDKEKGRSIIELEAPNFKRNQNSEKLRQRAEEKERTREALQQQSGGRPGVINRMQFTFSVDQPAQATPASAQHVKKPDLKPSSQFRDTVGRRARPNTRATTSNGQNASNNHSNDNAKESASKTGEKDPPSLTQIGRRRSPSNSANTNNSSSDDTTLHDSDSESQRTANQSSSAYSASTWGDSSIGNPASLHFPSYFSSDFGPSALLFPQPSLMTPLSYGEDTSAHGAMGERLMISRPTIEIPLDEVLNDLNMANGNGSTGFDASLESNDRDSPGAWSSAAGSTGAYGNSEDVEMKNGTLTNDNTNDSFAELSVPPMSQTTRDALPTTVHPSQVTPAPSVASSGRAAKPNLSVRTTPSTRSGANPPASTVPSNSNGSNSAPGGVKAECSNCGATHTPLWRRGLNDELNCNACGLYCKLHKRPRPKSMRNAHGEGRSQAPSRSDNVDSMGEPAQCYNCHTTATPLWRKDDEGKTVCNACGLYYKLHGSARPISMKSDVIRKRSRHDARRMGSGETPSASPGASRRASPTGNGAQAQQDLPSPTLAPDSSTAPVVYSYEDDYSHSYSLSSPQQSELMGALGPDPQTNGVYSAQGSYDNTFMYNTFPGPYHPDVLGILQKHSYGTAEVMPYVGSGGGGESSVEQGSVGTVATNGTSSVTNGGATEEGNAAKRRRMSVDSATEPPSSATSYGSYGESNPTVSHQRSHSQSHAQRASSSMDYAFFRFLPTLRGSSGTQSAFWHPPLLPQEKSPHAFTSVHPPMLPTATTTTTAMDEFPPMDFLHPPMLPNPQEADDQLFATYLHPPMALQGEDSPMAPMSSLHPPMLPTDNYYQQQHQMQGQGQGQVGQQEGYYDSGAQQQQAYEQAYN